MSRSVALTAVALLLLTSGLSCARNQHLESIQVLPTGTVTFGSDVAAPGNFANFQAFGTYVHPPQTKDITSEVTWTAVIPAIVQFQASSGFEQVGPSGGGCGNTSVTATFNDGGNVVISNPGQVVINGPSAQGCTPAGPQPVLTIAFAGMGPGQVTSPVLNCQTPSSCNATLTYGEQVTLTESTTGHFAGWSGCTSISPDNTMCDVTILGNLTVVASFNP
jgi:hypothetical protein